MPGVNANAAPFVPSWLRNAGGDQPPAAAQPPQQQQQEQATPPPEQRAPVQPVTPPRHLNAGASEFVPPGGAPQSNNNNNGSGNEQLLFYDSGRMIRPQDQPHFYDPSHAPPLPSIQVGRVGSMPTAHIRAAAQQQYMQQAQQQQQVPPSYAAAQQQGQQAPPPGYGASIGRGPQAQTVEAPPTPERAAPQHAGESPMATGVMPNSTEEVSIMSTLSRLHRPVIILVVGGRGSGKSTQAKAIALKYGFLHLSSGDLVRNEQSPLEVLDETLRGVTEVMEDERKQRSAARDRAKQTQQQQSADGSAPGSATSSPPPQSAANAKYAEARRGIVLDRYMTNAEADPYYLLETLHRNGFQLDLVVNLMMSYEAAVARAEERDRLDAEAAAAEAAAGSPTSATAEAVKPKKDQRRLMEHLTVWRSCNEVFEPYGGLVCLDVEGLTIEEVEYQVHLRVDRTIIGIKAGAAGSRREMIAPPHVCPGVTMHLTHEDYLAARSDLHSVLGTPKSKYGNSPGSLMTGLLDRESLKKIRWYLRDYHVTWKADGMRLIIARHLAFGWIAFTAKFTSFYIIDPKLVPSPFQDLPTGFEGLVDDDADEAAMREAAQKAGLTDVSHIFDAELVENNNGKWKLYVFDCLYAVRTRQSDTPMLGSKTLWRDRYSYLQNLCAGINDANAWTFICLKKFVPCPEIRSLVSNIPNFPTDGIVLQHGDPYKVPHDGRVYKWKPKAQCTVDFRLSSGIEEKGKGRWLFYPLVLRFERGSIDEVGFKNAIVSVSIADVEKADLSDGAVVECLKTGRDIVHGEYEYEEWEYHRPRPDKAYPNYENVAQQIDQMDHLSQPEVVELCELYCEDPKANPKLIPSAGGPQPTASSSLQQHRGHQEREQRNDDRQGAGGQRGGRTAQYGTTAASRGARSGGTSSAASPASGQEGSQPSSSGGAPASNAWRPRRQEEGAGDAGAKPAEGQRPANAWARGGGAAAGARPNTGASFRDDNTARGGGRGGGYGGDGSRGGRGRGGNGGPRDGGARGGRR